MKLLFEIDCSGGIVIQGQGSDLLITLQTPFIWVVDGEK